MVFKYGLPLAVWVVAPAVSAVVRVDAHDEGRVNGALAPGCQEVTAHGAVRSSDEDCHQSPPPDAADANATAGRTVRSSLAEAGSFSGRVTSLRSYLADAKAAGTKALHRRLRHVADILGNATVMALLVSAILGGAWVAYKFMTEPADYASPMDAHGAALYYAWREQQRQAEKAQSWQPPPSTWQSPPRSWPPPPPPQPRPPTHAEEEEEAPLLQSPLMQ